MRDLTTVEVGLINGIHPFPVKEYIFNGESDPTIDAINETIDVGSRQMTIEHFIRTNCEVIDAYGCLSYKHLIVYTTKNNTDVVVSLVKTCFDNKINLTLMYYDESLSRSKGYNCYTQEDIITDGKNTVTTAFDYLSDKSKENVISDIPIKKMAACTELYLLQIEMFDNNSFIIKPLFYIFKNKKRAEEIYDRKVRSSFSSTAVNIALFKGTVEVCDSKQNLKYFYDPSNPIKGIHIQR